MDRLRNSFVFGANTTARVLFALTVLACGNDTGLAVNALCGPGEIRCAQATYEQCSDDGSKWVAKEDCAADGKVCVLGVGCRVCEPNQYLCNGFDVVQCSRDGTQMQPVTTCEREQGDICNAGECVSACLLASEHRSYEGCEYWAVDLDNAVTNESGAAAAQQFSVMLSNASEVPGVVDIEIFCREQDALNPAIGCRVGEVFAVEKDLAIPPGGMTIVNLDAREVDGSTAPNKNDGPGTFRSMTAYRIGSTAPLIAYQFNPLDNVEVFSNDASLLLPTSAIDNRYLVLGWPQTLAITDDDLTNAGLNLRAFLTIVGTEDDTKVDVVLSTDILPGADIPAKKKGERLSFTINRGEIVNLETDGFQADFTGTEVFSESQKKPVAVFVGSEASDAPVFDSFLQRSCCADHMEQQVFPERAYGDAFIAVKSPSRSVYVERAGWDVGVIPDEPDFWRIMATAKDTSVRTNLPPPHESFTLQRGESIFIKAKRDFSVTANEPIAVAQVPGSQATTGIPVSLPGGLRPPGGDPSLILLPPIQQWRTSYQFLVPNKYAFDFLLIAAPEGTKIVYDGLPLDEVIPDCERETAGEHTTGSVTTIYTALRCPLSQPSTTGPGFQDDGVHSLSSENGEAFGLVVWGWDSYVSYGYPGGANVALINVL